MNDLKEFIKNFDISNPDWSSLPEGFPRCDLAGLTSSEVGKFNAILTTRELSQDKPKSKTRVWESAQGYKFLIPWSNAVLLRIFIRKVTETFPKSEYRSKAQTDDAARSAVANIEEGFKRATTSEYLQFLGYTQGSLEEVKGDVERWLQDGFIKSVPGSGLKDLGIDLKQWNKWARNPNNSSKILYFPLNSSKGTSRNLKEIKGADITYEMLIELINKTDWNLRKLVESLEKKLNNEKKGYQIQQARIKDRLKWKK